MESVATTSTIENEAAASSSNNISIPQLTDARKQEIRKKLLERQRQARLQNSNRTSFNNTTAPSSSETPSTSNYDASSSSSSSNNNNNNNNTTTNINNSNNNNTTTNSNKNSKNDSSLDDTPPNKEMIKKAVAFLSSPKVQSAPTSRKHSFLMSKGCTKKEIELAEKEIEEKGLLLKNSSDPVTEPIAPTNNYNNYNSQSQTPPPLPPRNYQPQNIPVVYQNQPLSRKQKVKNGLLIILFGGALIKGISIIVKREIMKPLRVLYQHYAKYLKNRNNVLNKYIIQVIQYCSLFINDKNKDNVKHIKTIEEIENEKEINKNEDEDENENKSKKEKESNNNNINNNSDSNEEGITESETSTIKKEPKERKAIKLKIHRKKETEDETISSMTEESQLVKKETGTEVRTLSAALQDYIQNTNLFESQCKEAIDNYAYDLERNSDLFSGSLGQTMKLSSEVYQIVQREMYYNSSSSSSFYMDSYQSSSDSESNTGGAISLYTRVNNIKSDIRRLKGMLLNHRNFPKYKQRAAFSVNSSFSPASSASAPATATTSTVSEASTSN